MMNEITNKTNNNKKKNLGPWHCRMPRSRECEKPGRAGRGRPGGDPAPSANTECAEHGMP